MKRAIFGLLVSLALFPLVSAAAPHSFGFSGGQFLLDGRPFTLRAGELHFQRIPREYWRDRLLKVRAMGLNAVGTYVFWNLLETEPGQWDFSGENDLETFVHTAREVGLWVVLRPGPYTCAEWDFGGLPAWLLRTPDIRVRCSDPRYLQACSGYIGKLAERIRPLMAAAGGPILMVQIENEYGSFGNDRAYLEALREMWRRAGIDGPFYTADGPTPHMLEAGTLPGAAIGLDPGVTPADYAEAEKLQRHVPVFCSEIYPGWLTHWGEPWAKVKTEEILPDLRRLLTDGRSFSLYMLHGGSNFGFTAGANHSDKYEPDITSYDYDAPLDEAGRPTEKYTAIRALLTEFTPRGQKPPQPPAPLPTLTLPPLEFRECASLFDQLPPPLDSVCPQPMEYYGQNHGFILYRTTLVGRHSGKLTITDLHDYASVYVDGQYLGSLYRGKHENTIEIPAGDPQARVLEILVEGMGRINFGPLLLDRKGITERVTLGNMTLFNWQVFPLPMNPDYIRRLTFSPPAAAKRPAVFHRAEFTVDTPGDTWLDMSAWSKGVVWVNGRNLGRYWNIGPQQRLFLPAPWLKKGRNEIVVFDLHRTAAAPLKSYPCPRGES